MYYGRSLEELAPQYVGKTYQDLEKHIKQQKALKAKFEALEAEANALPDGAAKYEKRNEAEHARKAADNAFLDIVNLIGGFFKVDDIPP